MRKEEILTTSYNAVIQGVEVNLGRITAANVERNDNRTYTILVTIAGNDYVLDELPSYTDAWKLSEAIMTLSRLERGLPL